MICRCRNFCQGVGALPGRLDAAKGSSICRFAQARRLTGPGLDDVLEGLHRSL